MPASEREEPRPALVVTQSIRRRPSRLQREDLLPLALILNQQIECPPVDASLEWVQVERVPLSPTVNPTARGFTVGPGARGRGSASCYRPEEKPESQKTRLFSPAPHVRRAAEERLHYEQSSAAAVPAEGTGEGCVCVHVFLSVYVCLHA